MPRREYVRDLPFLRRHVEGDFAEALSLKALLEHRPSVRTYNDAPFVELLPKQAKPSLLREYDMSFIQRQVDVLEFPPMLPIALPEKLRAKVGMAFIGTVGRYSVAEYAVQLSTNARLRVDNERNRLAKALGLELGFERGVLNLGRLLVTKQNETMIRELRGEIVEQIESQAVAANVTNLAIQLGPVELSVEPQTDQRLPWS